MKKEIPSAWVEQQRKTGNKQEFFLKRTGKKRKKK